MPSPVASGVRKSLITGVPVRSMRKIMRRQVTLVALTGILVFGRSLGAQGRGWQIGYGIAWSRFWSRTPVAAGGLLTLMTCGTPSERHSCGLPWSR